MRVGFIGVGGVAQPHLETVSKMDGVQLVAVCDIVEARANEVAQKYGAKAYSDYHAMIGAEALDACYVCVIPGAHADIELDLAKAKIPFYAEKPVHLDLDACARVIEAIETNNVINSVGYHWRYTKPVRQSKEWIDAGHKISLIEGWWYGGFVGAPWWKQMKLSGGQLVEQTTHIVDMARYLGGEVHTVFGFGATGAMTEIEGYDIHDTSIITLQFDSGAIGQITSGCIAGEHGGSKVSITAKGRDWTADVGTNNAKLVDAKGKQEIPDNQSWADQLGNGDRAFFEAIRTNSMANVMSPYISGAQTLAITLAANESMSSGQAVKVRRFV
jgi:myo-inositol 2-dehydrogenase/D-chiro-inositol 1-dehydrogenase